VLRNASIIDNESASGTALIASSGKVEISHATIAANRYAVALLAYTPGKFTIANSVLANTGVPNCTSNDNQLATEFVSLGGNVTNDASCGFHTPSDRVVANAGFGDFGTHGGVVGTLALAYNSPAIGSGLAANCEATDARGAARGQTSCDSGSYEFGGGQGKLGASGTTGLYFNHASNGHFVTVQRVFDNNALVIWNTFDETGKQAWVYGIGPVNGGKIHADQVAQNVGGMLHPGGTVTGITPTLWGSFDLDISSCYAATLSYNSVLPQFGSGTIDLERLAFVNGLDCSE
jgi:hypothetical protein